MTTQTKGVEVGCAGLLVADTFCGPMHELPREGQLLAIDTMTTSPGGCAANVAFALARQGVSVDIAGCVGHDSAGEGLLNAYAAAGVGHRRVVRVDSHLTSQTVILLVANADRRYIHTFGANAAFCTEQLDRDWLAGLKLFYVGGWFALPELSAGALAETLSFCQSHGVVTVLDVVVPQGRKRDAELQDSLWAVLPFVDYFLPNDDEAKLLTGQADTVSQLRKLRQAGAKTVIVTRGAAGAGAMQGNDYWEVAAYPVNAIDPSGSGDAFAAGVVAGALRGADVPTTLRYAAAVGASATRAVGTSTSVFTSEEAANLVAAHPLKVTHRRILP